MLITVTDDMNTRRGPSSSKPPVPSPSSQSAVGGSDRRRLRILRLQRPSTGSYGFHLRGGREHGTGFFISHVEPGTEAFAQGLRTGDQVLRVNDLNVSGALHKEVASLVRVGTEVILHVKSTGLIPVKNNPEDPLSWVLVDPTDDLAEPILDHSTDYNKYPGSLSSTGTNLSGGFGNPLQIIVSGAGKHTLGCSICKGPPEKPGIFVQRVRERGIAEEAGLRPGDQILSCNGISFVNTDFQQAVQAMKASPYLQLEVLRGAGLELVAGESSGYNSSASSETGEEHYPPSEVEFKDDFTSHPLTSTLTRLNGARDRIQLDANRDWKEIEAEWADAEVSEKRTQLENNHTILSQKMNPSTSLNKSFLNLNINETGKEPLNRKSPLRQPLSTTCNTCSHLPSPPTLPQNKKSTLSKPRSMTDLRANKMESSNFRIAMQMAVDEHVSKIVIPSAPKDEQNALLRLEELSSGGSKNSTLLPTKNSATSHSHSKTCSISSTSSEESVTHRLIPDYSRPDFSASLKENRQLLRCTSVPQNCNNAHSSEDSDSLLSFPSSTITLHKTGSGRFTSKIQIRSSPPPPPPRGNATKLTRQHRKLKCGHHRKLDLSAHRHSALSPPASPCTSSASSGDNHLVTMGSAFRRRQSLESLSASSDESVHWEDFERRSRVITSSPASSPLSRMTPNIVPPPPPPPPPAFSIPSTIPPPPPPPPLQVPSNDRSSFCSQIVNRQQEITGVAAKLKSQEQRSDLPLKKPPLPNPKKEQHEKLMEEFKRAHALMVAKRQAANTVESTSC